jgi:hypothetical protein
VKVVRRTQSFHSGTPESAPAEVPESFQRKYEPIRAAREEEALRHATAANAEINRIFD